MGGRRRMQVHESNCVHVDQNDRYPMYGLAEIRKYKQDIVHYASIPYFWSVLINSKLVSLVVLNSKSV